MKLKYILPVFVIVAAILAGCGKSESAAEQIIRIGYFPNITHAQALYGKSTGAFAKSFGGEEKIKWIEFNAGPAEIEAMFAGEVDIGYIGPIPAINAYIKSNGDVHVITGATTGGAILVTRSDLKLHSAAELSGLKIAVPQFGNTQHISLLNIISENGLKTSDKGGTVEVVQATNSDIKTLLDRKSVDAALVPEPWGARLINEIGANMLLDEKQIWKNGDYPVAVAIVSREFAEKNPDLVNAFLNAHNEVTREILSDPESSAKIINGELLNLTQKSLEPEVLSQAFSRIGITNKADENIFKDFAELLEDEGLIDKNSDISGLVKEVW